METNLSRIADMKRTGLPHIVKPCLVEVYFPTRKLTLSYFNDKFVLNKGDMVYVEGQLEGVRGYVNSINYAFKIKLSDYKRIIAVVDTSVRGEFYLAGSHMVTFDREVIPNDKVMLWFKPPEEDGYVVGNDSADGFPLKELNKMGVTAEIYDRGYDYYMENNVAYLCLDGHRGFAIVEGSDSYQVEFEYEAGEIRNIKCTCFCGYRCKHQVAAMLQLREILDKIDEDYGDKYWDYFAIISKKVFLNTVINKPGIGKINLEV